MAVSSDGIFFSRPAHSSATTLVIFTIEPKIRLLQGSPYDVNNLRE